jgi:hypothetical protein
MPKSSPPKPRRRPPTTSKVWDAVEKKLHCLEAVSRAEVDEARKMVLANIVETYVELSPEQKDRFAAEIHREERKEVREMQMTWADKLEAKGRAQGRAQGRDQGKIQGTREAIVLFWEHRLGPMPDEARQQLEAIDDLERLHRILEQVSGARSAAEIELTSST